MCLCAKGQEHANTGASKKYGPIYTYFCNHMYMHLSISSLHMSDFFYYELEWSGMEWSGKEWSGVEWDGMGWSGVAWSGVEWSGMEWNGMEWNEMGFNNKRQFSISQFVTKEPLVM